MFLNKLATIGAAGLLLAGTVLGGAAAFGRFGGSAAGGQGSGFSLIATDPTHVVGVSVQDEGRAAAPAKAEPTLESAEGLERARLVAAQKAFEALRNFYLHGQVTIDRLIHASEEFRDAQLPADGDPGRTREALQAHLARLEALKMIKEAQFGDGRGSVPDMADINVAVAETKFRLARPLPTTAAPMNSSPQPTGGGGSSQDGGGGGFGGEGLVEDPRVTAARPKFFRGIDDDPLTKEILAKLNLVYSFPFTADTPLEDVIRYIQTVTADNMHFPKGIPVYLDEKGMREGPSGATPQTGVKIALEGIPMRTVLRLMLKQLGLVYIVKDGLLIISSPEADNLLDEIERVPDLAAGRGGKEPPRGAAAPADRPDGRVRDDQSKAMGGGSGGIIPNDPDDPRRLAAEAKLYSALDDEPETAAVVAKLNEFYPFPFGSDTPLEEVMQHISKITECEELPHGIPVYLDEVGMNEANSATPASSVKLGFKRVRLRTALRLALKQLGLVFTVKDGILIVTSAEEAIDEILFGPDRRLREIPQPQGGGFR